MTCYMIYHTLSTDKSTRMQIELRFDVVCLQKNAITSVIAPLEG
jgi:hypothetical protein